VSEPTSPAQLNIPQAQASEVGLKITNGLTPMFWVFCAFVGTLILLCIWMLLTIDSPPDRAAFYPGLPYQGQPYQGQPYQGQPYQGQPYPGQPYWSGTVVAPDATQPPTGSPGVPSHPAPQQ
jgi:hypothetical protein